MTVPTEERARLQELLAEAIVISVQDFTAPKWGLLASAELATLAARISTAIVEVCGRRDINVARSVADHLCLSIALSTAARFGCADEVFEEPFAEIGESAALEIFERVQALHEQINALTLDLDPAGGE